jgi:tRNA-dihydrouridine synthase B
MAGVTDLPFRRVCRRYGAALTPSEMLTSNLKLWNSKKNRLRRIHSDEEEPRVVQIAGSDPDMMAQAAICNVAHGAQVIDINMGCPAKKVLKKAAGSALLKNELKVKQILTAVVDAVSVPVTLKIRTGWDTQNRNGTSIARIAEDCGIKALAVHGRTRACMFKGEVEYDTIAQIKQAINIPVFANGDINSPAKARKVLEHTQSDGIMIGRAAQGRPWIFQEIEHYLTQGSLLPDRSPLTCHKILLQHIHELYEFYGDSKGVLIARKHVAWYLQNHSNAFTFRSHFNTLQTSIAQVENINHFFEALIEKDILQKQQERAA